MTCWINEIDRVITTVAILVQAVGGGGVEVGSIVGADKSTPFGAVIPGVAIIQAGIFVVVVATVTNGVGFCYGSVAGDGTVAPHLYSTMICASSQEKATRNKMTRVAGA